MDHRTTVRIPARWAHQLDSARARGWIGTYLQSPVSLPRDPGPGDARADLVIPRPTLRALTRITREPASVALRRLFALNLGAPRVENTWTTAELVEEVHDSAIASSGEREEETRAYDPAAPAVIFQWIAEKLARPNPSPSDVRGMAVRPAPARSADPWLEEFARFNRSRNEETKMQLAVDPPSDPDSWRKIGWVIIRDSWKQTRIRNVANGSPRWTKWSRSSHASSSPATRT